MATVISEAPAPPRAVSGPPPAGVCECGDSATIPYPGGFANGRDDTYDFEGLVRCATCNLVRTADPIPLADAYRNRERGSAGLRDQVNRARTAEPRRTSAYAPYLKEAIAALGRRARSIYDFGCGTGAALVHARSLGLETAGHDINRHAVNMLRARGFAVEHCYSHDLVPRPGVFDVVTMIDYLDRSYAPFDDLRRCRTLIAPDGILYLRTAYMAAPHLLDPRHLGYHPNPGQIHHFEIDTLTALLERAGFSVVDCRVQSQITVIARAVTDATS